MEIKNRFSVSARRMGRSIIRELLKLANKPEIISFAGGFPALELSLLQSCPASVQIY